MNLTQKQNEIVELIKSKQQELQKKLFVRYIDLMNKVCIIDITDYSKEKEVIKFNTISNVNGKVVNGLLDKGVLIPNGNFGCILKEC